MAVRDDFAPGEVLAAVDLNDTFNDKVTNSGLVTALALKQDQVMTTKGDLAAFGTAVARLGVGTNGHVLTADSGQTLGVKWADQTGKLLQIVRATDSTNRTTTSTSFVSANLSVTITPQKSTSAILVIWAVGIQASATACSIRITLPNGNAMSGAETFNRTGGPFQDSAVQIGYHQPGTTSSQTYTAQFNAVTGANTATLDNSLNTGQLYAIEVSA
jgi:hypothetical protein